MAAAKLHGPDSDLQAFIRVRATSDAPPDKVSQVPNKVHLVRNARKTKAFEPRRCSARGDRCGETPTVRCLTALALVVLLAWAHIGKIPAPATISVDFRVWFRVETGEVPGAQTDSHGATNVLGETRLPAGEPHSAPRRCGAASPNGGYSTTTAKAGCP
jgi:hypothetical protein